MAIVAVSPGIAPTDMPRTTPISRMNSTPGSQSIKNAVPICENSLNKPVILGPFHYGIGTVKTCVKKPYIAAAVTMLRTVDTSNLTLKKTKLTQRNAAVRIMK